MRDGHVHGHDRRRRQLALVAVALLAGCGDSKKGVLTPEEAGKEKDGTKVTVEGEVHTVSWESTQSAARRAELRVTSRDPDWVVEDDAEEKRGVKHALDEAGADYPRTDDHYILIRSKVPAGVRQEEPGFTPGALQAAWGLGIHVTKIDPASPLPEVGTKLRVTGIVHQVTWNQREVMVPILDDATIEVLDGPAPLAGPGEACTLDQACNARLVCDRASKTCVPPPREIYWGDPWRDVNGACDTDADCPLGQVCDASHVMAATGIYAPPYFAAADTGRHLCTLDPAQRTVAQQCPRIYTTRDLVGARFVTGKEICVRVTSLANTTASDGDTHAQMKVDEPIPYPTADIGYHLFGGCTENGPPYKDPTTPGGAVADPAPDEERIAIGTYRYDPDHGWHEIHPVKAYLPPP